ncbi:MAG: MurR/RpiR family transcriptional regulator [Faecalibacillus sp.]
MCLMSKFEYQVGFSELEKRVADFMIDNKDQVLNMNLNQLAEATYVSTATISRFCRKLGEKNFNDFKVHFAKETQENEFTNVNFNVTFKNNDTKETISHNISEVYKQTIESTNQVLDLAKLDKAAETLEKAPIIDVFAVGDSYLSALMFQHKMTEINKMVNLKHIPTEQNQQAMYSNKNTVALVISYSGESPEIKKVVERISLNGGTIIAITSMNDSYVRKNANICLSMCSKENFINKIGSFSSKISSDYIIDLIYSLLFKKHYHQFMIDKVSLGRKWDDRRNAYAHEKG